MTARLTTALLACVLAAPAWSDPPKVPLFGRHKAAATPVPANAPAPAPEAVTPPPAPEPLPPALQPAATPIATVDVQSSSAAASVAAPVAGAPAGPLTGIAELRAAYDFALPVYEMMRTRYLQVSKVEALGAPGVNHLYARTTLADAATRDVTTPNNDTLYSSAWLDLAGGPVILTVPAIPGRYNSAALMDLFTDNVAIVGTRSGGKGGRYLIAGPGWNGTPPPQTTVLRSPTNDAWLLVRVLVNGPDDLPTATGLIRGFSLEVPADHVAPVPVTAVPVSEPKALPFLAVVNEALGRNPVPERARAFADLGLRPLTPANAADAPTLPPALVERWNAALPKLRAEVKGGLAETGTTVDGWTYPGDGIGRYGDSDDAARARVALGGLGALPRTEAIYLTATADKTGAPLAGTHAYTVHLPAHLPVGAFWSLTMYQLDAAGRMFFIDTPSKRFAVNDRTPDLRAERDGSYDIFVQPAAPSGERVVNWLPSPKGRFVLIFRAYLPGPAFLDGSFRLPPVEPTEVIP